MSPQRAHSAIQHELRPAVPARRGVCSSAGHASQQCAGPVIPAPPSASNSTRPRPVGRRTAAPTAPVAPRRLPRNDTQAPHVSGRSASGSMPTSHADTMSNHTGGTNVLTAAGRPTQCQPRRDDRHP
nr:unnamed protein product [Leishmania braziliensis]